MERDDELRGVAFAALDALRAQFGEDIPYRGGLDRGFAFQGARVPFLSHMKGIFRAGRQRGPAALSVNTSWKSPYDDAEAGEGLLWYAFRAGASGARDNSALRAAWTLGVPLIYFFATSPGLYRTEYPVYVVRVDEADQRVLLDLQPREVQDVAPAMLDRAYALRLARWRLHQGRFRTQVIDAYRERCAVCRLKERSLLDAAHIVGDLEAGGEPVVVNGLSLCSIHHRAFDRHLVGITPRYEVKLSRRLLLDEDGPMLELLKGSHGQAIEVPRRQSHRPDPDRLSVRFSEFVARGG